jgi:hypothetical protein
LQPGEASLTGATCGNEGKQACKIRVAARTSGGGTDGGQAASAADSAVAIEGNAINCDIAGVDKQCAAHAGGTATAPRTGTALR